MFSTKRFLQVGTLTLICVMALSGCGTQNQGGDGGTGGTSDTQQNAALIKIDKVDVTTRPTTPVQVLVSVRGTAKDTCEKVANISQKNEGNTVKIAVTSKTQGDDCVQKPVSFQRNIGINTTGLNPGKYTVDVNGVTANFELK